MVSQSRRMLPGVSVVLGGLMLAAPALARQPRPDQPPSRDDQPENRPPRRESSEKERGKGGRQGDRGDRGEQGQPRRGGGEGGQGNQYTLEQACSDRAQLHTIAFNGLAFMTGDFGSLTFIPPGKVSDFFGFQYMRDIDAAHTGHNPKFLDRVAGNVLKIMTEKQRAAFEVAAREQAPLADEIARRRLPLIKAFHRELTGDRPAGSTGLSLAAVKAFGAELFALDARLAYQRAEAFGALTTGLSAEQKAALAKMKFGDFTTWPEIDQQALRRLRPAGQGKGVSVMYMTLASEFFSWHAGSIEADTYFCPERHGTYFGGFYLKDLPAMGQKDYNISTSLTGDAGAAFLEAMSAEQRATITAIIEQQRAALKEIVDVRREISTRLRGFRKGEGPKEEEIVRLGRRYGELDAELAWDYATAFAKVYRTLTDEQKAALHKLRGMESKEQGNVFIYAERTPMAEIQNTDFLFEVPPEGKR